LRNAQDRARQSLHRARRKKICVDLIECWIRTNCCACGLFSKRIDTTKSAAEKHERRACIITPVERISHVHWMHAVGKKQRAIGVKTRRMDVLIRPTLRSN
jgi:hypothetical protein